MGSSRRDVNVRSPTRLGIFFVLVVLGCSASDAASGSPTRTTPTRAATRTAAPSPLPPPAYDQRASDERPARGAVATRNLAAEEYRFGPEDVIEVFVWKEPDLSTTATVRPDGRITLPLAGELEAAGKTAEELKKEIETSLGEFIAQPIVTVMVKAINSPQISVLGQVKKPGRYRIAQRATILDAIALGGGFTEFAKTQSVVVLRRTSSGVRKIPVDVKKVLSSGREPLQMESGDTVYVE